MGKVEKIFIYKGLKCVVRITELGYRCGYVGVEKTHPWYGKVYNECIRHPVIRKLTCKEDDWCAHTPSFLIHIHGGLSFADKMPEIDKKLWFFGFDCGHAGDAPDLKMVSRARRKMLTAGLGLLSRGNHIWSTKEVEKECKALANQLLNV